MTETTSWQEKYLKNMAAGISVYQLDCLMKERDLFREACQNIFATDGISKAHDIARKALDNEI